jgi:hypothetical protein
MEVTVTYTYTELKALLAESLSRGSIPTSTLSRWMAKLGYEPGQPGRRRQWDQEDALALVCYGQCMSWGYTHQEALDYTLRQVEKYRSHQETNDGSQYRQAQPTPQSGSDCTQLYPVGANCTQ